MVLIPSFDPEDNHTYKMINTRSVGRIQETCRSIKSFTRTGVYAPQGNWPHPTNTGLTKSLSGTISQCMIDDNFQLKIEAFMERHKLTPTTFGLWAMNDSRFVFDVRNGRECFGKTIRRVYHFMTEHELKQEAKKQRGLLG